MPLLRSLSILLLTLSVALLAACGGGGGAGSPPVGPGTLPANPATQAVLDLLHDDGVDARLWLSQLFAFAEGDLVQGVTEPLPGRAIRAHLVAADGVALEGGELPHVQILDKPGTYDDPRVFTAESWTEAGPRGEMIPGSPIVAFLLPDDIRPGVKWLRIQIGGARSAWTQIEVATEQNLWVRRDLAPLVEAQVLEALGDGNTIVAPYAPLAHGSVIEDGFSETVLRTVTGDDTWLFFAFETHAGFSQDHATLILVDASTYAIELLSGDGAFPDVVAGDDGSQRGIDYGQTGFQQNHFFNIDQGGGNPPIAMAPPAPAAASTTISPTGLTGRRTGPCPNGYKSIGVVIQLDDKNGFDWLRGEVGSLYKDLGIAAGDIHQLQPEDFQSDAHKKYDADKLEALLRGIARGAECGCAEVVITVISHGKVGLVKGPGGKKVRGHKLLFKNRVQNERDKKQTKLKKSEIATADFIELIARAFHLEGKDCIPVSVILHSCYSGKAMDDAKDRIKKGSEGANTGMDVIASSGATEPSYGRWKGRKGNPDIVFIDALASCMKDKSLDKNNDGTVSLDEAWACIQKKTRDAAAKKPIKKAQNPVRSGAGG